MIEFRISFDKANRLGLEIAEDGTLSWTRDGKDCLLRPSEGLVRLLLDEERLGLRHKGRLFGGFDLAWEGLPKVLQDWFLGNPADLSSITEEEKRMNLHALFEIFPKNGEDTAALHALLGEKHAKHAEEVSTKAAREKAAAERDAAWLAAIKKWANGGGVDPIIEGFIRNSPPHVLRDLKWNHTSHDSGEDGFRMELGLR